ncbi:MAG: dCTP deaminase [Candidatus Roizmanbacteria bacterium]|nr:dCTP deaminase [Candidatus Roizmanbacteria bacterium]
MLLSDIDIERALNDKSIVIKPTPNLSHALSACALDLRLNNIFEVFEYSKMPYFDPKNAEQELAMKRITISKDDFFVLQPGEFALASTLEWVELPYNIAARLEGRSSLGRLGIVVHSTAALIHPGMRGNIVLELGNHSRMPVALYPGMRVCSLSFEQLTQPAQRPYHLQKNAKYAQQKGVEKSRIQDED